MAKEPTTKPASEPAAEPQPEKSPAPAPPPAPEAATSETEPAIEHPGREPADRLSAIMEAIETLDPDDSELWGPGGFPNVPFLSDLLGFKVENDEVERCMKNDFRPAAQLVDTEKFIVDEAADKDQNVPMWGVKDTAAIAIDSATGQIVPRVHEPLKGFWVPLTADKFYEMPRPAALKFLCDKSFEVVNEKGQKVAPLAEGAADRAPDLLNRKLKPTQVIANIAELSFDSLFARAAQHEGGERFGDKTERDTLVRFLIQKNMGAQRHRRTAATRFEDADEVGHAAAGDMLGNRSVDDILKSQGL